MGKIGKIGKTARMKKDERRDEFSRHARRSSPSSLSSPSSGDRDSQPEPWIDSGCWCEGSPEPAYGQVVATILMD